MNTVQIPRRFVADPWGGTETVVLETSKRLNGLGHPTEIFTSMAMSDSAAEVMEGVRIRRFAHIYPYLGLSAESRQALDHKAGNLFSFPLWRALMCQPKLDVLHLHTGKRMGGIVRTVAQRRKIPYVISLHGGLLDVPASEVAGWTDPTKGCYEWGKLLGAWVGARRVMEDADAIVCVSAQEAAKVAERHPGKRVLVLPNGVDTSSGAHADGGRFRQEFGIAPTAPLLLQVGRIDPQKDQIAAVRAFSAVASRYPAARLVLIGGVTNNDYFAQLEAEVRSLGLAERVLVIPGFRRGDVRLWDAYAAATAVLVPSRHEPFGIVALEGWSMGKPVLACAVGGLIELVETGIDGMAVPPGDLPALSAAIEKVLADPDLAAAWGRAGREKVMKTYSWNGITGRLVDLYREVIDARSVRS